jgi:hypothetical protein
MVASSASDQREGVAFQAVDRVGERGGHIKEQRPVESNARAPRDQRPALSRTSVPVCPHFRLYLARSLTSSVVNK